MTGALRRVLIVGASIAGLSAARALRRAGYDGDLIALGAESEPELGTSVIIQEPIGVVGAITPWNYPLHQISALSHYSSDQENGITAVVGSGRNLVPS